MRIPALIALAFLAACVPLEARLAGLRPVTAEAVPCPASMLEIRDYVEGEAGGRPSSWTAAGCGRTWACVMKHGGAGEAPFTLEACREQPRGP